MQNGGNHHIDGMIILYKNKKAEKQFSSKHRKAWRYPKQVQEKLVATETFISSADSLMDIANYPPFHFEILRGDRKDEWSIRLGSTGYRVILYPCDDEGNIITGGDILSRCKTIKIIMVTEVTNHYE